MATLSAPYNNAMRLGQGFNSFSQRICIDSAVLFDNNACRRAHTLGGGEASEPQRQTVTYTARFVDKLSDIAEATNLSPSAAIKSGTIGSPGKGAFIDIDQFRDSDINFLICCKVISGTVLPQESMRFNKVKSLPAEKFHDVFGDTFISGFLEGGEFTSLISLKIVDQKRKDVIKRQAKVALTSPSASPDAERAAYAARKVLQEHTEVAISVNWSGGGSLKEDDKPWDIETIMKVAAKFPDLVHRCPQYTTALLTKYTAIRAFLETMPGCLPLEYENVGVYMGDLLDAYMEYKLLWRQIDRMIEKTDEYEEEENDSVEQREDLKPVSLALSKLDDAKKNCRQQMLRIVKEVDKISKEPHLAIEEDHAPPFMNPELFASLLPKRKTHKSVSTPSTPLPLHEGSLHDFKTNEQDHITTHSALGNTFLLSRRSGSMHGPPLTSQLTALPPPPSFPRHLDFYEWDGVVRGFGVRYATHGVLSIGNVATAGRVPTSIKLEPEERVVSFYSISSLVWGDARVVTYASAKTNKGAVLKVGDWNQARHGRDAMVVEVKAPEAGGLKGFYGCFGDACDSAGVIWGR